MPAFGRNPTQPSDPPSRPVCLATAELATPAPAAPADARQALCPISLTNSAHVRTTDAGGKCSMLKLWHTYNSGCTRDPGLWDPRCEGPECEGPRCEGPECEGPRCEGPECEGPRFAGVHM
eukprot:360753-Chlamydomonas_euryale.AAC.9